MSNGFNGEGAATFSSLAVRIAGEHKSTDEDAVPRPRQAPDATQSQKTSESSARAHIMKAQTALQTRDLTNARAEAKQALKRTPKLAEAYFILGLVDFQNGETKQAIEDYQRGLEFDPRSFSGHYNLALAYLREHRLQAGERELQRAVALDPKQADAAYNLGMVLLELGRSKEAVGHLRDARTLSPGRPDAAFNLVRAELAAHQINQAREEARRAAQTFAGDPAWEVSMGQLFLEHGQPRDAVGYLTEAALLNPSQAETRRQLASAYLELQQPDLVLAMIPAAASAEDHALRSNAYSLSHQFERADEEAKLALEQDPDNPSFLLLWARIIQHFGQHDAALVLLAKAISVAPDSPDLYYSAAVSYYFERRYAEARQSLSTVLRHDPNSSRALFLYAAASVNAGNTRDGEEYLRRAIKLEPTNARFYYHLGALYLRINNTSAAEEAIRKAIKLKPDYAVPHYQIGRILSDSGHAEDAARELETAVRYDPELAAAYYQLARIYARLGETAKSQTALAAFERLKKLEVDETQDLGRDIEWESERHQPAPHLRPKAPLKASD